MSGRQRPKAGLSGRHLSSGTPKPDLLPRVSDASNSWVAPKGYVSVSANPFVLNSRVLSESEVQKGWLQEQSLSLTGPSLTPSIHLECCHRQIPTD